MGSKANEDDDNGVEKEDNGIDPSQDGVTTVSELNASIGDWISSAENLMSEFVVGEVTDAGVSNSTLYFQLTDDDASIQCLVFNNYRNRIDIDIEEGMEIAVVGELSFYEAQGNCSIYVHDALAMGEGAYQQKLEKLREELTEEGLFDDARKQPLPDYPEVIGVVTSVGSDAQEDALNAIHTRYPDVDVRVHGANVQGDRAPLDLEVALNTLDVTPDIDTVILTRGGGSNEDLRAFNEEDVVRTVADMDTPTVAAIGHEMDQTLVGAAADYRAMTPTDAGEAVVTEKALVTDDVTAQRERVNTAYSRVLEQKLDSYRTRVDDVFDAVETQHEHEQEVAATKRRYKLVIAALLALLLLGLFLWWFL